MRTEPRYAPWFKLNDQRTRNVTVSPLTHLVPPGNYQVQLVVDSTVQTQPINVLKDPHSEGTVEDIRLQYQLLDQIRADYEEITGVVNEAERIRRQLLDLKAMLPGEKEDLKPRLTETDSLITIIENRMIQLEHTGTGQDIIRKPGKLLEKLSYLSYATAVADFRPADQHNAVFRELHEQWLKVREDWKAFRSGVLADVLQLLQDQEIGPVILSADH